MALRLSYQPGGALAKAVAGDLKRHARYAGVSANLMAGFTDLIDGGVPHADLMAGFEAWLLAVERSLATEAHLDGASSAQALVDGLMATAALGDVQGFMHRMAPEQRALYAFSVGVAPIEAIVGVNARMDDLFNPMLPKEEREKARKRTERLRADRDALWKRHGLAALPKMPKDADARTVMAGIDAFFGSADPAAFLTDAFLYLRQHADEKTRAKLALEAQLGTLGRLRQEGSRATVEVRDRKRPLPPRRAQGTLVRRRLRAVGTEDAMKDGASGSRSREDLP